MNEKIIKSAIEHYNQMSDEQLMAEFIKHFASQKSKDGGESMRKTIERIKPLLNEQQRKRMEDILKNVESGETGN